MLCARPVRVFTLLSFGHHFMLANQQWPTPKSSIFVRQLSLSSLKGVKSHSTLAHTPTHTPVLHTTRASFERKVDSPHLTPQNTCIPRIFRAVGGRMSEYHACTDSLQVFKFYWLRFHRIISGCAAFLSETSSHTQTPVLLQPLEASLLADTHRYDTDPDYFRHKV